LGSICWECPNQCRGKPCIHGPSATCNACSLLCCCALMSCLCSIQESSSCLQLLHSLFLTASRLLRTSDEIQRHGGVMVLQVCQKQANKMRGQTLLVHDLQVAEDALVMHRALYSNNQSGRGVNDWHPCAHVHSISEQHKCIHTAQHTYGCTAHCICTAQRSTHVAAQHSAAHIWLHSTHMAAQHIVSAQHSTLCLHSTARLCLQSINVTQHDMSASSD